MCVSIRTKRELVLKVQLQLAIFVFPRNHNYSLPPAYQP